MISAINKQARNETHFDALTKQLEENYVPFNIRSLYHSKSPFYAYDLDSKIKDFVRLLTDESYKEVFLVLGHSYDYAKMPFMRSYNRYPSTESVKISNASRTTENVIFKNIISLDSGANSLANVCVKEHVESNRKGGCSIVCDKRNILIYLILVTFIICIVYITIRNIKPICLYTDISFAKARLQT